MKKPVWLWVAIGLCVLAGCWFNEQIATKRRTADFQKNFQAREDRTTFLYHLLAEKYHTDAPTLSNVVNYVGERHRDQFHDLLLIIPTGRMTTNGIIWFTNLPVSRIGETLQQASLIYRLSRSDIAAIILDFRSQKNVVSLP